MGAVFAMFSGWYFWIPKMLGLNYNILLSKVQFWILFIGVKKKGSISGISKRWYSESSSRGSPFNPLSGQAYGPVPRPKGGEFVIFFFNIKEEKKDIYKVLRNKSGVYMLINNKTKDFYIGSSLNLTKRMVSYYYYTNSDKLSQRAFALIRAMKKYGLENFSLGILEFCKKDSKICLDLEQKALDKYKPNYNVLKVAGNSFGFKHRIDTIIKLKQRFNKENHPKFDTVTSSVGTPTKKAISEGIKKSLGSLTNIHPAKGLKGKLSAQYGIGGQSVFCYSNTGKELIFPSINATKQHFKVRWTLIKKNLDTEKWITLRFPPCCMIPPWGIKASESEGGVREDWILQSKPKQK